MPTLTTVSRGGGAVPSPGSGAGAGAAGMPYVGPPARVFASGDFFLLTYDGSVNWNLSVGVPDQPVGCDDVTSQGNRAYVVTCDARRRIAAAASSNDAIANQDEVLVYYDVPGKSVHNTDVYDNNTGALESDAPSFMAGLASPPVPWPSILADQPGKCALWLLPPTLNALGDRLATLLGGSFTEVPIVDHAHLYLGGGTGSAMQSVSAAATLLTVLQQGILGRPLSALSLAFLAAPSPLTLAQGAPAIVVDCAQALAALAGASSLAVNKAALPYQGPLAKVLSLPTTTVTTGKGTDDWNRSVGSGGCSASDATCNGAKTGYDVVVGIDQQDQPLGLVCYANPYYAIRPFGKGLPAPDALTQPGMEVKLGLWLLEPLLNLAAQQLGLAPAGGPPLLPPANASAPGAQQRNDSNMYLEPGHVQAAQQVLAQIGPSVLPAGRALSPATAAFLANPNPTIADLALAAPAISYDLAAAQVALVKQSGSGGSKTTPTAPATSSKWPWIAGGAAVLVVGGGIVFALARRKSRPMGGVVGGISVERVHLDAGGYDHHGRYWGSGQPLYRVEGEDGKVLHLRAESAREARTRFLAARVREDRRYYED